MVRYIVPSVLMSSLAVAGALYVFYPNQALQTTQISANFRHIHSLMVGGHGPRLMNGDVKPKANIDIAKLETNGRAIPSFFTEVGAPTEYALVNRYGATVSWGNITGQTYSFSYACGSSYGVRPVVITRPTSSQGTRGDVCVFRLVSISGCNITGIVEGDECSFEVWE